MALEELSSVQIRSVSDLIDIVKENSLNKMNIKTNSMSWYRGQSNYEWHLEPAVYRDERFKCESVYIREFERVCPSEFQFDDNFDKLVKMQHYGLPTRLLDLTSNPLVALFFACQGNKQADGAIYLFSAPTFWQNNWAIKVIIDYIFEPEDWINNFVRREAINLPTMFSTSNESKKSIIHTLCVPAHPVMPKMTNQRILRQSGGFLLFGMSILGTEISDNIGNLGEERIIFGKLNAEQEALICPIMKKIRVLAEYKDTILEELALLNIHESFLFPELDHQSRNIVNYVDKRVL